MESAETAKIAGLVLGLVVVVILNNWIFPNDLANTLLAVFAAP